jgi:hypothetical protein
MMKQNTRAKIVPGQYYLWPDENGILTLPQQSGAPSKESRSRHLRRSPRVVKVLPWLSPRLRSLSSSLSLKSSVGAFFGMVVESLFVTWLTNILLVEDFNMISLALVISRSKNELGLDEERTKRLIIKRTTARAEFRSDGQFLTLR